MNKKVILAATFAMLVLIVGISLSAPGAPSRVASTISSAVTTATSCISSGVLPCTSSTTSCYVTTTIGITVIISPCVTK